MRCAVGIGLDLGYLVGVLRRCAVGIGGRLVVSDAPCHCDLHADCVYGVFLVSWCRGIGGGRVLLRVSGVAVPWGLVGACSVGSVWCRCTVGMGREHVVCVECSMAVPWGLVGGASSWVGLVSLCRRAWWVSCVLGFLVSCQVVSCRVVSCHVLWCRVVWRHLMSLTRVVDFLSLILVDDKSCWLESLPRVYATVVDKSR